MALTAGNRWYRRFGKDATGKGAAGGGRTEKPKRWHERTSVTLAVAAVLALVGMGFIHVITGVEPRHALPFDVARRVSFGYRETFVNASRIKALPYPVAKARYPLGCQVLQSKGYMAGGRDFEARAIVTSWDNLRRWQDQFEKTLGLSDRPWQDRLRDASEPGVGTAGDAFSHNRRGIVLARSSQYAEAIAAFTRAVQKAPAQTDAYYNRALVYVAIGNLGQAAADFGAVIDINPGQVEGYLLRGDLLMAMNQYDEAAADFSRAIEIDPACVQAFAKRSLAHYGLGRYEMAWADVNHLNDLGIAIPSAFLSSLEKASRH